MSDLKKYVDLGKELGYVGDELKKFANEERTREEALERERRPHEREMKQLDLEVLEKKSKCDVVNETLNNTAVTKFKGPRLPLFDESKDQMDSYIERYERYAAVQNWDDHDKAVFLGALLRGKALDVYSRLTPTDASDYSKLKDALLRSYQLTEDRFRKKFFSARPSSNELPSQFIFRLETYFDRWVKVSSTEKNYTNVRQLILTEQFLSTAPKELAIFLRERKPKDMSEVTKLSETFMQARGWNRLGNPDGKSNASKQHERSIAQHDTTRHSSYGNERGSITCFSCHKTGHVQRNCPLRGKPDSKKNYLLSTCVADGSEHECSMNNGTAHLSCGCTLPVVGNSCQESDFNLNSLPISDGRVEGKPAKTMRDTGCNCIVVKISLIANHLMTGRDQKYVMIDRPVRIAPIATVNIETPFYCGKVDVLCLDDPICDLVIGNVPGVTIEPSVLPTNDRDSEKRGDAANTMVTRSQVHSSQQSRRPLSVAEPIIVSTSATELGELQKQDKTLRHCRLKGLRGDTRTGTRGSEKFAFVNKLLYRFHSKNSNPEIKQLLVPDKLRNDVLKLAHDSVMSSHLGIAKTIARILNNFYWPGIGGDVTRFCKSCDVCQKTLPKGRVTKVPVQKMPLIDTPFRRVAIDIVGPITPRSKRGNKYILTLVDYATRYPEAVALPSIETDKVAEALLQIFSRVGVPNEIISDNGSQLTSGMMSEVCKLMSIDQMFVTPYHAMANGLVEKFNGTLKQMLRKICESNPEDWDRYIEALLFSYREVPQCSTGFSPFELVYGRTVRGPMNILKELWTKEDIHEEVKTTYKYVLDLRNRLEEVTKLALENLSMAQDRYKINFDRRAKARSLSVGSKVLILLPTKSNKLLLQWRGPFQVVEKIATNDYRIQIESKFKVFHINMLKQYNERQSPKQVSVLAAFDSDEGESEDFDNEALLKDYPTSNEETYLDVNINPNLSKDRFLQNLNFRIEVIKGKHNVGADYLSRLEQKC